MSNLENILDIVEGGRHYLSNLKPSEWAEKYRVMPVNSPFPGKFSYDKTPYTREIVDCLAEDHPARIIAVMKGAQIGMSGGLMESGTGWIISQNPGNILLLTGHSDLSDEAMAKIDEMIDSCGIRHLIKPSLVSKTNRKSGDTAKAKEFPGGSLVSGSATNHKLLRQRSVKYAFIDDFDAAPKSSKQSGSTSALIEQRLAAYYNKMKLFYISTPELKISSNIEQVFFLGDQRRYMIPCPCCGEFIALDWSIDIDGKEKAGITWKVDHADKLIEKSVGYICQMCGNFFNDSKKHELNLAGYWQPMVEPSEDGYYSYHISSLYAPAGMYDWKYYVRQYMKANPKGEPMKIALMKTFTNLVLGQTWEDMVEAPKASHLVKNTRNYDIGIIPESLSERDGNGKIVLLTCACDLNGREDDSRLDWEIVGWAESGSSYSIAHGSIGTFLPRDGNNRPDRIKWTYEHGKEYSVWPEFEKVISQVYVTDTGRRMKIFVTGVDTGNYTMHAYSFVDNADQFVIGLKGKDPDKYVKFGIDLPSFRHAKERSNLYLVEVNQIKDELAERIKLKWDAKNDKIQPAGFLNFPMPSGGLYTNNNYFSHYEAEHKEIDKGTDGEPVGRRWVKRSAVHQNHHWDICVYGMVLKEIVTAIICREAGMKSGTWGWNDYVKIVKSLIK